MSPADTEKKFSDCIQSCNAVVKYTPLPDEVDYTESKLLPQEHAVTIVLPQNPSEDPFVCAQSCISECKSMNPYVLVPGQLFDQYGNRRGRGGGWYDRFLSAIPRGWLRIGVTDSSRFVEDSIHPQPHDEPMDWILVFNVQTQTWSTQKAVPEKI